SGTWAGGGGTQTNGGSGGVYNSVNGSPGTLGMGGNGSASDGGAGGGGYYGGGGGTASIAHHGGGGGSSYAAPSASSVTHTTGTQVGHGQVLITPIIGTPAPGTITGAISVCSGGTFTYSISSVPTATSYVWSAPPGSTVSSGQGTTTVEVTFGTDTGDISVSAIGPCGTSNPTLFSVVINPAPVVVATATPPQYCWGGSSQLNAAGGVTGLVTVGTGTVTNTTSGYPAPYGQYYTAARHQMLIRASELNAAGFYAGNINSLAFYVATPNGAYSDFTISLATTALSALTTTFVTGATQVFITPNFIPVAGWNTHTFQTPFYWNGTSNLIVETYFMNCPTCPTTACSSVSSNAIHHSTNTSYVSSNYYRANLNCNVATQTTGTTISRRPNMRFGIGPLEYSWSPATALSNDTITNPIASPTATITYTATITDGYGCSGMDSVTVSVDAPPAAPVATSNSPVCAGSTLNLFADPVPGGSYQWTGPNGFTASLQNISVPNVSSSFSGTYSVTVTVNGCVSPPTTVTVVVNQIPATPVASSNSPVCEGSALNLFATTVPGASYNWSGPNGFSSSNQNPIITTPTAAASGTYSVFATENGCNSASSLVTVQVNANPAVSFTGLNTNYCLSAPAVTLTGSPQNGTFSGPGINGNIFSPSVAGIGMHTIQYSFTDANGCSGAASQVVIINNPAATVASSNSPVCEGSPLNLFASTVAGAGYNWSGPNGFASTNQNPVITSPTAATSGTYTVFATENGCNSSPSQVIVQVNANPVVSFAGLNSGYCLSNPAVTLSGNPPGGIFTGPGVSGNTFDPAFAGAGTHTIMYAYSDANGCSSSESQMTTISNNAFVSLGPDTMVCNNAPPFILIPGSFSTYVWQDNSTGPSFTINPPALGIGFHTFYVHVTDANGCAGVDSIVVNVSGCVGFSDAEMMLVSVSPNPTSGIINITIENYAGKTLTFKLTNIAGQVVFEKNGSVSQGVYSGQFDLTVFSKGIYYLDVNDGARSMNYKIVLQ
ncbi:MAG TPA: T9SS type A sorting domain-containing protein, partial [Bacteroidia bacterium]|nr:T9SS type A sorting domain-containing protein [Bacteroidia bacterium]